MAEPLAESKEPERADPDAFDVRDVREAGALRRGTSLGRYELVVPIAMGGMARVWAARMHGQRGFTKLVAIKTILPHLASNAEFEQMFLDEARIASDVHHPNVCEIYELGEERGILYLAMEWVNGAALSHVLRVAGQVTPLDPRIAARIIADACAGLHAAHRLADDAGESLGVVHRDVSPQNVLLSADGNVKVADFGVAKALGTREHQSAAGQLKGKLSYMAPEQASGKPVDRRSDIFALGCVLYEATTGKKPFRGEGEHEVLQRLLRGELAPPSRALTGFPHELERIILRAMSPQPLHRYPSMDGMRLALEEWLAKSGPVVTQSHVAAVVRQRAGSEIDERKERIRLASAAPAPREESDSAAPASASARRSESGIVPAGESKLATGDEPRSAPSAASAALPAMSLAPSARPARATDYVIAAALGVLGATALGVGGFFVWRSLAESHARRTEALPHAVVVADAPPVVARVDAAAAVLALPDPARLIAFRILPESATLVVDGAPLGAKIRTIPRPSHGAAVGVVVRAEGFAEQTLTVDDGAPETLDVWLVEKGAKKSGAGAASPPPPVKPTEALPANPY